MRTLAAYGTAAVLLLASQVMLGQPAPDPAGNPDEAGENNPRAAMQKKRAACRQEAIGQGLRGPELQDQVAVCVQERMSFISTLRSANLLCNGLLEAGKAMLGVQ